MLPFKSHMQQNLELTEEKSKKNTYFIDKYD